MDQGCDHSHFLAVYKIPFIHAPLIDDLAGAIKIKQGLGAFTCFEVAFHDRLPTLS